ncbi:[acyl-carrier-protein] S-malonyltransferase [Saccharopolyspora lacisalsi]|uniref:[acyl-carrier-protein] S-malonyltransferase n=1 Tax=Halosaccharopolyspora lacisalsi TaxID=1000566 RepID=A0A839E8B3_9PSEU|nr:ACP S-malonyltransferase [Halosaccharopolyspora lacisalsi]MBA8827511.1 [acyl-carrier-protein] S-malonyltransferase [Halosaccharopolyspora lacisalsi]
MGEGLYEQFEAARRCYFDVEARTGLSTTRLLRADTPDDDGRPRGIGAIRQTALAFAAHDVLADFGITPSVLSGLSLGALVSAGLAGSITRAELLDLLMRAREVPVLPEDGRQQAVATIAVPVRAPLSDYQGAAAGGVYLAGDLGPIGPGERRLLVLSGHHDAVRRLPELFPEDRVTPLGGGGPAVHSPLQGHLATALRPHIERLDFHDPVVPICSCLEAKVLRTGDQVRDAFLRNSTSPVSVPHMHAGLEETGAELGVVVGPSRFDRYLSVPFPVVHVEEPEHVRETLSVIHELGVDTSGDTAATGTR